MCQKCSVNNQKKIVCPDNLFFCFFVSCNLLKSIIKMESELIKTDDGEYIWFNSETNCYELLEIHDPQPPLAESLSEAIPPQEKILPGTSSALMKPNVWNEKQTKLFLEICSQNKERLTNMKYRKSEVYKEIAVELQKNGYCFSAEQCANRMKTLTAKYKEIRDHNSKSGNGPKTWVFFDLVADYLGERPGITPKAICSSIMFAQDLTLSNSVNASSSNDNSNSPIGNIQNSAKRTSDEVTTKNKRICKRVSPRVEMVKWLKEYKTEVAEREERRISLAREQHNENKEMLVDILNIMKRNLSEEDK